MDPITELQMDMAAHNLDPGRIEVDEEIHRFPTNGRKGDKAGWYVCFRDPLAGAYGNWRTGETFTWSSVSQELMTPPERHAFREKMRQAHERRQQAQAEAQAKAAQKARDIWKKAKPATPQHPYLSRKGLKPMEGIRQLGKALVVPVRSFDGKLYSLQFIQPDGSKRFLRDGKISGCASWIRGEHKTLICEGWATGASLHQATGYSVVCSFNAGNLGPVIKALREAKPNIEIIICGDNDQWNQ